MARLVREFMAVRSGCCWWLDGGGCGFLPPLVVGRPFQKEKNKSNPMSTFSQMIPTYAVNSTMLHIIQSKQRSLASVADGSTYETFLRCMSNTNSSDQVSSLIFYPNNSSYTSTLQAYIRNRRFNTSTTPKPLIIVTPLHETHVQSTVVCSE